MADEITNIDLTKYVTASDAVKILSEKAGKPVHRSYMHELEEWGFLHPIKLSSRTFFYSREELENYKVGQRGDTGKGRPRRAKKEAE